MGTKCLHPYLNTKAMKQSLDIYDYKPQAQKDYLSNYGWHFNKKSCDWACRLMKRESGNSTTRIEPWTKEQVEALLAKHGVKLQNVGGYDHVYVANMCRAVFLGKSVTDEPHLAQHVKDVVDDVDSADGNIFRCWYAKMIGNGQPIEWEDFL